VQELLHHWMFAPYAQCLHCQKETNIDLPLLRTVMLSSVTVKLESSIEMTAALSQSHTQTPKFVTINEIGDEVWVIFGLFHELCADSNAVFLWSLLSNLGTNFASLFHMLRSSNKIHWHIPYDSPTVLQMS
jgi:hypothetical protein